MTVAMYNSLRLRAVFGSKPLAVPRCCCRWISTWPPYRTSKSKTSRRHSTPSNPDHGLRAESVKRVTALRLAALKELTTDETKLRGLKALVSVLARYPLASAVAHEQDGLYVLLNIREKHPKGSEIECWTKQACSLLGHVDPPASGGLRILSLDGGGNR